MTPAPGAAEGKDVLDECPADLTLSYRDLLATAADRGDFGVAADVRERLRWAVKCMKALRSIPDPEAFVKAADALFDEAGAGKLRSGKAHAAYRTARGSR